MSRLRMLLFMLVVIAITSYFEWRSQLASDLDPVPRVFQKQQPNSEQEDVVIDKIILLQEKNIQRLNELVRSLNKQLQQCRNGTSEVSGR